MRDLNVVDMLFGVVALLGIVFLVFGLIRMFRPPAAQREGKALVAESIQVTRENNALLKELIAVNRQILDKQNRSGE